MYCPRVSIVIPAYNAANFLAEAIDSALAQTYRNTEIIVVNDGSMDDGATKTIALKYGDKIRYFEKSNGGSSSALNTGIKNMTGEWFSWLSHDDLYYPDKIECEIKALNQLMNQYSDISSVAVFSGSELVDVAGNSFRKKTQAQLLEIANYVNNVENAYLIAEPTKFNFSGCTCLIHKKVFETIGYFDENLRLLNDFDMWFRIYSSEYHIHFVPKILVKSRVHDKQVSTQIGFSYHNPEQDMYWNRTLDWLIEHYPQKWDLYFLFGRNAYLKTRNKEGQKAFEIAFKLEPSDKTKLKLKRLYYKTYALLRTTAKKCYLLLKT